MKATTQKFKQIMASGNARDYVVKVDLTLADDPTTPTVLHLDESDMWNDSFKVETASSGTSSFDIGTAIIGQCKFALNNFDERFNQYDFFNATAVVYVGLKGDEINGAQQYVRFGFFTVDEPTFAGALIELVLLDNMWKFDRPLKNVQLTFPITSQNAVVAICSHCGVTLQTQQFHGYNFTIAEAPKDMDKMNCREFLQYVAMIGCNFCIINEFGDLEIKWYDTAHIPTGSDLDGGTFNTDTTPYSDGDTADGGNFIDYTSGDSVDGGSFNDNPDIDYFTRNFQLSLGTDVITITGVKFVIDETAYTIGTEGYRLELENPLVNASNVNSVLNLIWDVLENFSLRTFNLTCASDLSVEVGDCCAIKDYKGNYVYSWVTYNVFAFNNHQIQCNAIPPTRTLTKQYSKTVQAAVEQARRQTDEQISDYDLAVQRMNQLAANASGLYWIDVPQSDGTIIYYESDKPLSIDSNGNVVFTNHSHVWKKTSNGFFSTASSGTSEATTTWTGGIDANNNAVMNTVSAIGINADWINAGQVTAARMATNVITAINAPKQDEGVYLTFDDRCETEGTTYDYIKFYYVENDVVYSSHAYGGISGEYSLAGKTLHIPKSVFYVEWSTDSSVQKWGVKVTSGGKGAQGTEVSFTSGGTLPSTYVTNIYSNVTRINTNHPYGNNEKNLWKVTFDSSLTIKADRINIDGTVTLTDFANGLENGTTEISGGCIKSGTIEGITLIAQTSGASKLVIENGDIKAYYGNTYLGKIQTAYAEYRNEILFDFAQDSSSRMFINAGDRIELQIDGWEKVRIEESRIETSGISEVTLYNYCTFTSYCVNADDHFRCDGLDGYTGSFSAGGYNISIHGGIITDVW